jgi:hypothetical protein
MNGARRRSAPTDLAFGLSSLARLSDKIFLRDITKRLQVNIRTSQNHLPQCGASIATPRDDDWRWRRDYSA